MRLAFITSEFPTEKQYDGGLSSYLARIGLGLTQLGHEVLILVCSSVTETLEYRGMVVHRIGVTNPTQWFGRQLGQVLFWWRFSKQLEVLIHKLHQQSPIAVVQTPSIFPLFWKLPKGVRHVHRLSSYLPMWREALGETPNLRERYFDYLEHCSILKADYVFAPSEIVAKRVQSLLKKPIGVIETPFAEINQNMDPRIFNEQLHGKKYLLYFGALQVYKGILELAEAIPQVLEAHPDLYLVLIGRDHGYKGRALMAHLRKMVGPNSKRLLYFSRLPHNQLMPILSECLAVVSPSRADNLPNTCLEAFYFQRLVVGTRGASFEQLIVDGENGVLCERCNPESLRAALEKVLQMTDSQRKAIGQRAKARLAKLTPEKVAQQWLEFCQL